MAKYGKIWQKGGKKVAKCGKIWQTYGFISPPFGGHFDQPDQAAWSLRFNSCLQTVWEPGAGHRGQRTELTLPELCVLGCHAQMAGWLLQKIRCHLVTEQAAMENPPFLVGQSCAMMGHDGP